MCGWDGMGQDAGALEGCMVLDGLGLDDVLWDDTTLCFAREFKIIPLTHRD